jgi:hypoxanthine phosphoribosyltransferase
LRASRHRITELAAHPRIRPTSFNERPSSNSSSARRRRRSNSSADPRGRMKVLLQPRVYCIQYAGLIRHGRPSPPILPGYDLPLHGLPAILPQTSITHIRIAPCELAIPDQELPKHSRAYSSAPHPMSSLAPTIKLSWEDVHAMTSCLANRIALDGVPDLIVGIARGGVVPSVLIAHSLGVRPLHSIAIQRNLSDLPSSRKAPPSLLDSVPPRKTIQDRDILLVDDIVGSGDTLRYGVKLLLQRLPFRIRTVACVLNLDNWRGNPIRKTASIAHPTYIGRTVEGWTIFPWEIAESLPASRTLPRL